MKTRDPGWLGMMLGGVLIVTAYGADTGELTEEIQTRLDRDGFCISTESKGIEMADPYLDPGHKKFITSDSVLALFHGVLRRTMDLQGTCQGKALLDDLKRGWGNLEPRVVEEPGADPDVCKAAIIRARIVCGTALRLLEPAWRAQDPGIGREIEAEAARVEAAKEPTKPAWLGKPEPCFKAIDYSQCKPVGLYAQTPEGCRYFRAVRFLQMIPFRLSRKEELFAACYILQALHHGEKTNALHMINQSNRNIGAPSIPFSGWVLHARTSEYPPLRAILGDALAYQATPDLFPPSAFNNLIADIRMPAAEYDTRMMAPLATPDAAVFRNVMEHFTQDANTPPDPLLAAAWLGDQQAEAQMRTRYPGCQKLFIVGKPNRTMGKMQLERVSVPLLESYDDALRTLMTGPETGTPDFMRKEAWHLKTRQTVLAAWARMRNCFALEAGGTRGIGGGPKDIPGFVEPCPGFYQKLGMIAHDMAAFSAGGDVDTAIRWSQFGLLCARLEAMAHKQLRGIEWNDIDRAFFGDYGLWMLGCDDDPRAASVVKTVSGSTLIAASGHHQGIWVNYPWKGKNVLCRGAVMTFYSFMAPEALNDTEWQERLNARPAPKPPEWLEPLAMPASQP